MFGKTHLRQWWLSNYETHKNVQLGCAMDLECLLAWRTKNRERRISQQLTLRIISSFASGVPIQDRLDHSRTLDAWMIGKDYKDDGFQVFYSSSNMSVRRVTNGKGNFWWGWKKKVRANLSQWAQEFLRKELFTISKFAIKTWLGNLLKIGRTTVLSDSIYITTTSRSFNSSARFITIRECVLSIFHYYWVAKDAVTTSLEGM